MVALGTTLPQNLMEVEVSCSLEINSPFCLADLMIARIRKLRLDETKTKIPERSALKVGHGQRLYDRASTLLGSVNRGLYNHTLQSHDRGDAQCLYEHPRILSLFLQHC